LTGSKHSLARFRPNQISANYYLFNIGNLQTGDGNSASSEFSPVTVQGNISGNKYIFSTTYIPSASLLGGTKVSQLVEISANLTDGSSAPLQASTAILVYQEPSISAGTGISAGGTPVHPSVTNTGVLSVTDSNGVVSTGGQYPNITNTGVSSVNGSTTPNGYNLTGGTGINVSNNGNTASVSNSGVSSVTGTSISNGYDLTTGSGIAISKSGNSAAISNTGVLSVNGQSGNVNISSGGVQDIQSGTGISVSNGTGPTATVTNTGVTSVNGQVGNVNLPISGNDYTGSWAIPSNITSASFGTVYNIATIPSGDTHVYVSENATYNGTGQGFWIDDLFQTNQVSGKTLCYASVLDWNSTVYNEDQSVSSGFNSTNMLMVVGNEDQLFSFSGLPSILSNSSFINGYFQINGTNLQFVYLGYGSSLNLSSWPNIAYYVY
jgi:hypothetical protein